jgi:hypothetical protein
VLYMVGVRGGCDMTIIVELTGGVGVGVWYRCFYFIFYFEHP